MFNDIKRLYRSSLKSMDTEERIDLAFYRPIGFAWAYLCMKLHIRPNAITIASIFIGVAAGWCFYYNSLAINCAGMLLLIWANSFDSADGQLARLTHDYSRLGRILDGLSSELWFVAIYVAICLRENAFSPFFGAHPWLIWLIAVVAGACHAKQAAMADYYRQFHLLVVRGEQGTELENGERLRESLKALSWRHNFWRKLVQTSYVNYTLNQEQLTPQLQQLRRAIAERYPDGQIPPKLAREIRRRSLPLIPLTNILSFNWRTIVLFTTLFIGQPWWYFIFELVVLNGLLIYMRWRHERFCRRLTAQLTA